MLSNFGISKLLGTGARILGDASIDFAHDLGQGNGWDAVSNLSLSITQPLLRGFGADIVMEPLTQAERNVVYAARTYERVRRTFSYDVASRYYRLLESYDRLANEIANRERTIELRERNDAFSQAGRVSDIEVDDARQNELSAETRVIEAQQSLDASLDDFKFWLGLPIDVELRLDLDDETPLLSDEALELELVEENIVAVALEHRLDHLTVLDRVEDSERRLHIAEDGLRSTSTCPGTSFPSATPIAPRSSASMWRSVPPRSPPTGSLRTCATRSARSPAPSRPSRSRTGRRSSPAVGSRARN